MSTIKLSIVICTYNRERFLPGLFESIKTQTLDKALYEVVLVNNNSTDRTEELCREFMECNPDINSSYFVETNQGLSYARNRGIVESKGEYVTFADDDALLAPDFSAMACAYLDAHPEVGEVGGPILLQYMGRVPAWENPYMNSLLGYFQPSLEKYRMTKKNRCYPRGSNMTFRSSIFQKCGMFNVALGRVGRMLVGGEEKDIAYRIFDAGEAIDYDPSIVVYHLVPEERTTMEFIKRQAIGTGQSERVRSSLPGNSYTKRIVVECAKWAATIILWFRYMLTLKPAKANTLVRFRWWVSMGLLNICNKS